MIEDRLYKFKDLYDRSPGWLKQAAGLAYRQIPLGLRYGATYGRYRSLLNKSANWGRAEIEAYQLAKLQALLSHASENVPFYKESFARAGFDPKMLRSLEDMRLVPTLSKADLQDRLPDLIARNIPKSQRMYVTTGGSTGIPVGFYLQSGLSRGKELAFIEDQWARVGFRPGDHCAFIRGAVLHGLPEGVHWQYEPIKNRLVLSGYHLTAQTVGNYVEALRRFRPKFLHAYPSSATLLATYMRAAGLGRIDGLKGVLCGSENLYPAQRGLLETVFGCRVFSWYGHAERAVLGGECEFSSDYHLYPQYGYSEVVDSSGESRFDDGAIGEIVASCLDNLVMPLIRYRTMDMGVVSAGDCRCGRPYPRLRRVEGRLQEFMVTGGGRLISMVAINMHSPVFDNVRQFQFRQREPGVITFAYVPMQALGRSDEVGIRRELGEKLGADVSLILEPVDEIPRTPSGKFRFLIQEIADVYEFSE